ncbi:MAG: autotransporter-associated beta strand repeat-containing protein, partial [Thermoguttaceae bacterium]|nr:autotransporter-associated beta strand repeat-containing protein [Thermoguttaceae bacterium]
SMGKMRLAAEQPFGANAGTGYIYGQLDMNGYSQVFKGLYSNTSGSTLKGQIFNNTDKLSTLTLNITGNDLTYQGKIDGNIELVINSDGAGKQTLNNNQSTFTGNVVVNGGTLVASAGWKYVDTTVFGDYVSKTVTVNDGAELVFAAQDVVSNSGTNSPIQFIANGGTIRNSGTVYNNLANTVFTDGAQLYAADGNATWKAYKLSSKVSVLRNADGSAADAVTFSSDLTKANATYSFGHGTSIYVEDVTSDSAAVTDTNSDLIISAVITNPNTESNRTFYKDGAGILEFTAANTFNGTASIREGVLRLTGDGTLGTSAVAIGEAGTLEIAYEDPAKNVDISSLALAEGGTFKLTSGTVSVDGAFSAGDGSQLVFELGGDTSDLLVLGSGSTLDISDDAVLELLLRDGVSGTYTLIEAENGFGDYADAAFWTDLLTAESDYFWNLSIVGNSLLATADPNVVPEPATWVLLVLGISGICFIRRKNAK